MPESGQTYANHSRFLPPYHFFVLPILLANFIVAAWHAWQVPSISTGFACLVAFALVFGILLARVMVLSVQDRVIRLEMRLRMREVLPVELQSRVHELSREQLIGLRFASDAELADLVRRVLAGELANRKAIKLAIRNWQGDYLRA